MAQNRFQISRDTPALYLTAVTNSRLPVFRTDNICRIACDALDEARNSGDFLLFAYVLMPDHIHVITDGLHKPSHVLRYMKGIASRRIIDYLKEEGFTVSLEKLRHDERERHYRYSLWQHETNALSLISDAALMQKLNTFIRIRCVLDWSNERLTIAGRAFAPGRDARWKMSP